MKFTAFNGSPVGENSAAGRMLGVFLAGAARAGAETELYHLGNYSIGQCVQHDDMEKLLRAYQSADVVCLDSPVYSWNMTALLKNLADRLIPLKSPLLTEQAGYEFAAQGEVTAEPRTQLDAPLMSAAEYVQVLGMEDKGKRFLPAGQSRF